MVEETRCVSHYVLIIDCVRCAFRLGAVQQWALFPCHGDNLKPYLDEIPFVRCDAYPWKPLELRAGGHDQVGEQSGRFGGDRERSDGFGGEDDRASAYVEGTAGAAVAAVEGATPVRVA